MSSGFCTPAAPSEIQETYCNILDNISLSRSKDRELITAQASVLQATLISLSLCYMRHKWKSQASNQADLGLNLGTCSSLLVRQPRFTRLSKNQPFFCLVTLLSLGCFSHARICRGQDGCVPSNRIEEGRGGRTFLPFKDTGRSCPHLFCSHPIVEKIVPWPHLAGRRLEMQTSFWLATCLAQKLGFPFLWQRRGK